MLKATLRPDNARKLRLSALLAATALAGLPSIAWADQIWTGAAGTNWSVTGNWSGNAVPGPGERAYIEDTGLTNMPTIANGGNVAGDVYIGGAVNGGTLQMINGGFLTVTGGIAIQGNNASMTLNATGGSTFLNTGNLVVGTGGTLAVPVSGAAFSVLNGAHASVANQLVIGRDYSRGEVRIDGTGSILQVGGELTMGWQDGRAQLDIIAGGTLTTTGYVTIGDGLGSVADVLVDGSTWTHSGSTMHVGAQGKGTVSIVGGGVLNTTGLLLGNTAPATSDDAAGGRVEVSGTGSRLISSDSITVAQAGRGTLVVDSDGYVQADGACLACGGTAAIGKIEVKDGGELDLMAGTNSTFVGAQGRGELNVGAGGIVRARDVIAGRDATASAYIRLNGTSADTAFMEATSLAAGQNGDVNVEIGPYSTFNVYDTATFGGTSGSSAVLAISGPQSVMRVHTKAIIGVSGVGTAVVGDGGTLAVLDGGDDPGVIEVAQGSGSVGTLYIGSSQGNTPVAAGTIVASRIAFGAGIGRLVFNHGDTGYDFGTEIVGGGNVSAQAGVTRLTGINDSYFGILSSQGNDSQLLLNGQIGSAGQPVTIASASSNGTIGGSGVIYGNVDIADGKLAPGGSAGSAGVLTINGDLALDPSARLVFDLAASGAVNDRIDVAGDLALDGTLDVANAGGFGQGLYRLINYGGDLDDQGLDVGLLPAGWTAGDVTVQTAVAGQVNLLVGAPPATTNFWNGRNTSANGSINGGSGHWTANGTNWTDMGGTGSGAYDPSKIVVFAGSPGTVTVDNLNGLVTTPSMQFASNGYVLDGDQLTLSGAATIRVGDGSAAGSAYVATFANDLTGAGSLTKTDLGRLVLNGDATIAGGTTIASGTLAVNGTLAGGVTVANGGALGGSGIVDGVTIAAGGILRPGNSIGTLNVTGDIGFAAGSTYQVEVNAAGQSDRIDATGHARIDGGSVQILAESGTYAAQTRYTLLAAAGGRTGIFDAVTSNLAFLAPTLSYDSNNVYLTLDRNAVTFGAIGQTPNQVAVGYGVDSLGAGNAVYDAAVSLSVNQARNGFDQLSGEVHASMRTALIDDSHFVRDAMAGRLALASGEDASGVWGQAFGSWGTISSDGNAAAVSRTTGGFLVGADSRVFDIWRLGVTAGYGGTGVGIGERSSSGLSDNYHAGLYGGTDWQNLAFRTGAAITWHDVSTARDIALPGFSDSLAGEYHALTSQLFGELAYGVDAGALRFEPFANFAYINLRADGFTEAGGAAALTGAAGNTDMAFVTLGARASTSFELEEVSVTARGMIGWQHALSNGSPTSSMQITGGDMFAIAGAPLGQNALVVEAGLDLTLSPNATLGLNYGGQLSGAFADHSLKAQFSAKF